MELIEEKLRTLTSYHGVIVNVRLDEARLPDGSAAKREVVEHPGGVTARPFRPTARNNSSKDNDFFAKCQESTACRSPRRGPD